ncbi:alpha-L-fucosidase 1 [Clohesyomyces aquaticus]|uniref:alpha-L-fucosidase n=1 Tax=Clohesyomyces aquaticus TaxID=1231657 RepID=A0A1Y2A4N2_9PLEO|nr:alpha-L-fucosidase 1 [Clohesyomyces aquaticus]
MAMKDISFLLLLTGFLYLAQAQSPPAAYLRTPTQRQLDWFRTEYYAFLHFGPNTFTDEEWGRSQSTPDVFNPTGLDTDQWAKAFVDIGMKGMILTAKHHDGMCLWNTSTTTYKVGNGNWAKQRAAKGLDFDVVRMLAASAKKYGLRFGVYLSPWDIHRDPAMSKSQLKGTIFDEPQIFGTAAYNDLYTSQLTELVTMKLADGSAVNLYEVWLDGASGSSTSMQFNFTRFRDVLRTHQPGAVMWGDNGPDVRYIGNENGIASTTNWHTINLTPDQPLGSGSLPGTGVRDGKNFVPAEANSRLRPGWFWHANEKPTSGSDLFSRWLQGPGRSAPMLLDVPPNKMGLIGQDDIAALSDFKRLREGFLNRTLITPGLQISASSVRSGANATAYGPSRAIDGSVDTYWTMDDSQMTGSVEVDLGKNCAVDGVIVQEHIALGQRIGGWTFDAMVSGSWKTVVTGTSLGYKRVEKLSSAVQTSRVRLRITQSNAVPLVQNIQVLGVSV